MNSKFTTTFLSSQFMGISSGITNNLNSASIEEDFGMKLIENILNQIISLDQNIVEHQLSTEEIKVDTRKILETLENI